MSMMVNPYAFGVAAPSDITIAVQDFATGTTTGSGINYTSSTITGKTPAAALILCSRQVVANEPNSTAGAEFMMSALTSTANQGWYHATYSDSGTANTSVKRIYRAGDDFFATMNSTVTLQHQADTSLISGGISANYTVAAASWRMAYVAFAGADVLAKADTINLGTATTAQTITTSFTPRAVIFAGANYNGAANAVNNAFAWTFGIATWDGTTLAQRCVEWGENTGAADGNPFMALLTTRCSAQINPADGALNYHVTASNFTSTSFDVTQNASSSSDLLSYLALNFGNRRTKLVDLTTPTSTGSQVITGAGFTPQFALIVLTTLEAVDPTFPISTSDLMDTLCISYVGDEQWAAAAYIDSGAATTSTASTLQAKAICLPTSTTATSGVQAALTSFNSDGMTLNYTAVTGTAKKGFILFVE